MLVEILLFVSAVGLLLYLFNEKARPKGFPPGLWRFPVLGSVPLMKLPVHKFYLQLHEKYGNIFSLYLANFPAVVISDPNMIRDALKLDAFSGRPDSRVFTERSWGKKRGILFNDGPDWQEQRRFALKTLRDFGFGKGTMENLILDEIVAFTDHLKKTTDKPVSLARQFNLPVLNALWHLIAGERFELDDQRLKDLIRRLFDNFGKAEPNGAIFFMPWFTKLAPKFSGWEEFFSVLEPTFEFLRKHIDEHKKSYNPDNPRDLIDTYLEAISKTTDPNSGFYKENGEKTLIIILLDLFAAGAETVSSTLNFAVLYLLNYPEVQEKLQKEIESVIGSRAPSLSDRPKMQYMEAFIAETLRYSSFAPNGLFHNALETVEFHGYTIPKGTIILPNLWKVHHDPTIWGDPQNFRPGRFINESGNYIKNDNLLAFSVGKRVCIGESLARDELFLFLTGLLQTFVFEAEIKGSPPTMEPNAGGFQLKTQPFNTVIRLRNNK